MVIFRVANAVHAASLLELVPAQQGKGLKLFPFLSISIISSNSVHYFYLRPAQRRRLPLYAIKMAWRMRDTPCRYVANIVVDTVDWYVHETQYTASM